MEISQTGRTSDPKIIALSKARMINRYIGSTVVFPWTVDDFPEDWGDYIDGLENDLPEIQSGQSRLEEIRAKWLKAQGYKHGN